MRRGWSKFLQRLERARSRRARNLWAARLCAAALALASYWAPWVAHPAAGLTIAEVDFPEFPKFMPQVRSGELVVWREAFYVPLLVLAAGLALWASQTRRVWLAWLLRGLALFLPLMPSVFNVLESGELQTQLRLSAVVLGVIVLAPLRRKAPVWMRRAVSAAWFAFGALAPTVQFFQMKPALDSIYGKPVEVGWGVWAGIAAFGALGLLALIGDREA